MIKLKQLYNEIKIVKRITADEIMKLYREIIKKRYGHEDLWKDLMDSKLLTGGTYTEDENDIKSYEIKGDYESLIRIYQKLLKHYNANKST